MNAAIKNVDSIVKVGLAPDLFNAIAHAYEREARGF